jgi:hypothetical protein
VDFVVLLGEAESHLNTQNENYKAKTPAHYRYSEHQGFKLQM